MEDVYKSNDPIALSALQAVLQQAQIESWVFDTHTSILEGSLGVLPRRLVVASDDAARARRILAEYQDDLESGRLDLIADEPSQGPGPGPGPGPGSGPWGRSE